MDSYNRNTYPASDKENPFASASLIMGVLAILTIVTGILPFIFGGLGILFATLARRRKKLLATSAFIGLATSVIGIFLSFSILCVTIVQLPEMLKDPTYRAQMNDISQATYGVTFDEMLEQSGIDLDSWLNK